MAKMNSLFRGFRLRLFRIEFLRKVTEWDELAKEMLTKRAIVCPGWVSGQLRRILDLQLD